MGRLQTRLVLAFALVILFVLFSVSVVLLLLLRQSPEEQRLASLELSTKARVMVALLRRSPRLSLASPGHLLWDRLDQLAAAEGERVIWVDSGGVVAYDSAGHWEGTSASWLFERLGRNPATGQVIGRVADAGHLWTIVAQPVPGPRDASWGYLILARPVPVFAFLERFQRVWLAPLVKAGLAALILGVVVAWLLSRSVAAPLRRLTEAARALTAGDLTVRVSETGPDEVRELAQAFNEMATRVETSQQAQRDLVTNIAHDLRTPLTSIQGFAQALAEDVAATPEARRKAAVAIREEAQRMDQMTRVLLDLARVEAGESVLDFGPVDLVEVVQDRLAHLAPLAKERRVRLEQRAAPESLVVTGDRTRLEQVVDNLLHNALEHTAPNGWVQVTLRAEPPWAVLAVADNGEGIPPGDLPRIFERFYRVDRSRQRAGFGLGLAIVKQIVEAHKGTIDVQSKLGTGTTFYVRFPLPSTESTPQR